MADQLYVYAAPATITCDNCRNVAAGDQVDIFLDQVLIPALPESIRGIVQLVNDLDYTIQYDDVDLLGATPGVTDAIVLSVSCVSEVTLANEHSDAQDVIQDARISAIEAALASLGVVPPDGDAQFVVHPDSEAGVSVESVRHDKDTVALGGGSETIILDPEDLASPLAILDLTDLSYRIDVDVSGISEKVINDRDSAARFALVGTFDKGATVQTLALLEKDGVTITAVKVGNNLHISLNNPSSGNIVMFVTSRFRILS